MHFCNTGIEGSKAVCTFNVVAQKRLHCHSDLILDSDS